MKRLFFLTTAFVFILCGIAQAIPLVFEFATGTTETNVQFNAFSEGGSTSDPTHSVRVFGNHRGEVFGEPEGNYNFKVEIEGVEAGHFTSVDGLSIEQEVIDYTNNVTLEFTSDLPGIITLSDPEVRRSNSFDLLFSVFQSNVGTSAYTLHWDTGNQPLEFDNISAMLNPSIPTTPSPAQLIVDFDFIFSSDAQINFNSSIFTTTISGDFTPVQEPSTILLLSTGLVGLAGFRKKFRN